MTWESVRERFGNIVEQEVAKRYSRNNHNVDRDDYLQTAFLAAWEYCRDRDEEDVDPRYVRARIKAALYNMAARSIGMRVGHDSFRRWASGDSGGRVAQLVSLDALDGDAVFWSENRYGQTIFEKVDAILTVQAFISTLSPEERRALAACVHSGKRDVRILSRRMNVSPAKARTAMGHLRRRCTRYFDPKYNSQLA